MQIPPNRVCFLTVTTTFDGIHSWENIPEDRAAQFLQYAHRHKFFVTVKIVVSHGNRQVEFFEFREHFLEPKLRECLDKRRDTSQQGLYNFYRNMSCEMLANDLFDALEEEFRNQILEVSVFEDNENGATIKNVHNIAGIAK